MWDYRNDDPRVISTLSSSIVYSLKSFYNSIEYIRLSSARFKDTVNVSVHILFTPNPIKCERSLANLVWFLSEPYGIDLFHM